MHPASVPDVFGVVVGGISVDVVELQGPVLVPDFFAPWSFTDVAGSCADCALNSDGYIRHGELRRFG